MNKVEKTRKGCILVSLNLSKWERNKRDKKATRTVEETHNVGKGKARANKTLCSSSKDFQAVERYIADTRVWHRNNTLEWDDYGRRIVPAAHYFEYIGELSKRKAEIENLIDMALLTYDEAIEDDKKDAPYGLGDLFNRDEYPPEEVLRSKYGVKVVFEPIPKGEVGESFDADTNAALAEHIEDTIKDRIANAEKELYGRVAEAVDKLVTTISKSIDDGLVNGEASDRWHGTLITNVTDLADMLPKLNLAGDEHINQLANDLKAKIGKYTADQVKASPSAKQQIVQDASSILDSLKDFM